MLGMENEREIMLVMSGRYLARRKVPINILFYRAAAN